MSISTTHWAITLFDYHLVRLEHLSYLVQVLSHFIQDPRQPYLNVVVCILRYIKLSPSQGIFLPSTSALHLQAYCDLDWASCLTTRRSTSSYVVFLGDSHVS